MSHILILASQKSVPMNHADRITHMDIPVISSRNHGRDIDINNIDTMRSIMAMTIINLARCQRYPRNIGIG